MKHNLEKRLTLTILLATLLIGAWLRLTPAALAAFPINDGGMFYAMIGDLQHNGYAIPAYTSYNHAEGIPFAYPPFPLYLAAVLAGSFHFSVTAILLWLPAFTSIAVIFAFYFLAKNLLASRLQAALAALLFALIPRTYSWFLMGGGLTRAFGQLFLMLTAISAYHLFTGRQRRYLPITILAGTLAVLSHPEAALHTVGVVVLIWYFRARSKTTFLDGILVALGVGVATAIWWLPVVLLHGITPFLNAAQTGEHSIQAWIPLVTFSFTEEPLVQFIAVIGLIGLFVTCRRRDYFFAAWFILPFVVEPRSATWILTMPLAMVAAISLTDLLLPGLAAIGSTDPNPAGPDLVRSRLSLVFLGGLVFYSLLGSYAYALKMGADHLSQANQAAMDWVSQNTSPESRFVILTGAADPMHDPVQEWFPALTGRDSATTLQGREWTWGKNFIPAIETYTELQNCSRSTYDCFVKKAHTIGIGYDYIYYVPIQPAGGLPPSGDPFIGSILGQGGMKLVYGRGGIYVFQTGRQ